MSEEMTQLYEVCTKF